MISLPLYRDTRAAVETVARVETTAGHGTCRRCSRHKGAQSVCIQPEIIDQGVGPTLLLVGERPGVHEDRAGRPFVGRAGDLLRNIVKDWRGKVVIDNALRCYSGDKINKKDLRKSVDKCQGYSLDTIELAKPERIVALGSIAALSLLGRPSLPYSVRKSYAWLSDGTPVFLGINPAAGLRNRFVARWFEEDLRWAMTCEIPAPTHWDSEFTIVRTPEDAQFAAHTLREAKWFGFDIENSGVLGDEYYRVLCLAACPGGTDVPFVWDEQALNDPATSESLFKLLEDPGIKKTGHNVKHDMLAMRFGHNVMVRGIWSDSMIDRRIAQSDAMAKLPVSSELVGMGGLKAEAEHALASAVASIGKARKEHKAVLKSGAQEKLTLPGLTDPGIDSAISAACRLIDVPPKAFAYALLPYDVLVRYCALDAIATTRLTEVQRIGFLGATKTSTLEECDRPAETIRWTPRAVKLSRDFMTPAVEAYEAIEAWGIGANVQAIDDFNTYLHDKRRKAIEAVHAVSEIDPGSRDEVERLVYDKLGISCSREDETESGKRGTGKEILKRLRDKNPEHAKILSAILEYRRIDKLLGTYTDGFRRFVRSDRRIHPNFKVSGTDAGRPSCEDPNMQVLPRVSTIEGKMSRDCFDADDGYVLVEGDYSQIELRCAGMLSGDSKMIDAFVKDEDLHWRTSLIISQLAWGIPATDMDPEVHKKERTESKVTTFGLIYGKTVRSLAKDLGIPVVRAESIVQAILGGYSDFSNWCDDQIMHARRYGESFTYWDGKPLRRRPLWQIGDVGREDSARAITARNASVNSPIQGTASDFCLRSAIEGVRACKSGHLKDCRLIWTIHDSNIYEVPEDDVDIVIPKIAAIMLQWPTWNGVPLKVDFKVGKRFGSMKDYKVAA